MGRCRGSGQGRRAYAVRHGRCQVDLEAMEEAQLQVGQGRARVVSTYSRHGVGRIARGHRHGGRRRGRAGEADVRDQEQVAVVRRDRPGHQEALCHILQEGAGNRVPQAGSPPTQVLGQGFRGSGQVDEGARLQDVLRGRHAELRSHEHALQAPQVHEGTCLRDRQNFIQPEVLGRRHHRQMVGGRRAEHTEPSVPAQVRG